VPCSFLRFSADLTFSSRPSPPLQFFPPFLLRKVWSFSPYALPTDCPVPVLHASILSHPSRLFRWDPEWAVRLRDRNFLCHFYCHRVFVSYIKFFESEFYQMTFTFFLPTAPPPVTFLPFDGEHSLLAVPFFSSSPCPVSRAIADGCLIGRVPAP